MKFKVGDKVRVIGHTGRIKHHFVVGSCGKVMLANWRDRTYDVMGDGGLDQWVSEVDLELVKDDEVKSFSTGKRVMPSIGIDECHEFPIDRSALEWARELRDTQVKHHAPKVYEVYEELKRHVWAENAISATDLCRVCGVSSHRELREIMREIRRSGELEKIPCSCNKGYYMASTKEEAQKAIDRLVNTAKNELKTAYTMAKKLGLDRQMKIQFDEVCNDTYNSLMVEYDDDDDDEKTDCRECKYCHLYFDNTPFPTVICNNEKCSEFNNKGYAAPIFCSWFNKKRKGE